MGNWYVYSRAVADSSFLSFTYIINIILLLNSGDFFFQNVNHQGNCQLVLATGAGFTLFSSFLSSLLAISSGFFNFGLEKIHTKKITLKNLELKLEIDSV